MPVFIDELQSKVDVQMDELPLTNAQFEKLVELIIARLEAHDREHGRLKEASAIAPDILSKDPWD